MILELLLRGMGDKMDELREAMNSAWDESEKKEEAAYEERHKDDPPKVNDEPVVTEEVKDEGTNSLEKPEILEEAASQEKTEVAETPEKGAKPEIAEKVGKAPASWSPKAREAWEKVPAAAQAQIAKREQEVNQVLQQSAESRKAVASFNNVLAPYREGLMAAGYQDPFSAINSLLQVESGLRAGSNHDRAQGIANLINHYGVDIAALDNILSGQPNQQQQPSGNLEIEQLLDQRMAPINQFLQQQQQQQQYGIMQEQQQATAQVSQFGSDKEFMNDVRMDMADLMDMAANRGEPMSLDQAYTKACAINPEVSQIMQQRQNQQNIMGTNQNAVQKRAASVSLTGAQGGAGGLNGKLSLRDTIVDAWNSQSSWQNV